MEKIAKRSSGVILICLIIGWVSILCSVPSAVAAEKVYKWNFSLWGGPRAWTKPLHAWAKDMEKATNGRWQIKLHYGGALAPPKENWDGIKAGMFEAAGICSAYTPGKNPLHTVAELPFIAPNKNINISRMQTALWEHPALLKEMGDRWNAVPLLPACICQYHLMGNKRISKTEDLKGARTRIGGEIARVLKMFGAVPTLVPAPEVYQALERGTIDMVGFPWTYSYGAYKAYEVSKYVTIPMSLGTMACFYIANKDAWDALPENFKQIHKKWYDRSPEIWAEEYKKADDKWIPIFKKKIEFVNFPESERNKLVAKAQGVYEKWVEAREKDGLPGRDVFNYYLAKRKEITGK
ncbi:MAG: TRAP transporter substrate-binding protein DctP [Deltaproteobacteria bacterium]|nr:TRAP transporter substrate-binding protein DctP [Deltaproteobacteria bacterium]